MPTVVAIYLIEVMIYACSQNLTRNSDFHSHKTRYANDFSPPLHKIALFDKKLSYLGAQLYNMLPTAMKNGDLQTFKRDFKPE